MNVEFEKKGGYGTWRWTVGGQSEENVAALVDELEEVIRGQSRTQTCSESQ